MRKLNIPVNYYDQTSADLLLNVPAEGFGGWKKTELTFDLDTAAFVVMHAAYPGSPDEVPGIYRSCDETPRQNEIDRTVFPPLFAAIRKAGVHIYHIGFAPRPFYKRYDGFVKEGLDFSYPSITASETTKDIFAFKRDYNWPGKQNLADIAKSYDTTDFLPNARPAPGEPIVENTDQLFGICQKDGTDHLIYIGFCIDGCIQSSACGMIDMGRRGFLCTAVREATTAIENKETSAREMAKEKALADIGIVFGADELIGALSTLTV